MWTACVGILAAVLGGAVVAAADTRASRTVVFVCEHGNVKSLIARELFNRMSKVRGSKLRAVARGLAPEPGVPPAIAAHLRKDGFDVRGYEARQLTPADAAAAVRVIAIGSDPPAAATGAVPVEKWLDVPPASEQYAASRDALRARIAILLDELQLPEH
jgi:arsenate reductase